MFQAILENHSITAAAEMLGLTQSAVSKQLKLLRDYFEDELFVRTSDGMVATNRALALAPQINTLIENFEALHGEGAFNPANIEKTFVISTTDEIQHFLLPGLLERIESDAAHSRIIFRTLDRDYASRQLESGSVDLVVTLNWQVPEHLKQKRLFTDDFVCIHGAEHPLARAGLTLDNYLAARHMMISPRGMATGPVDEVLVSRGLNRSVSLTTPYFMQVADALLTSDLLLTVQRRAAMHLAAKYPLAITELPLSLNPAVYSMFWHKRYDKDSTSRWLREVVSGILYEP